MKHRTVAVVFVVSAISVLAAVGGSALWLWTRLYEHRSPDTVDLVIAEGLSGREVLSILADHDLLPSTLAGRLYLRFAAEGRSIHFGNYRFEPASRPVDVLERLLDGRVEMIDLRTDGEAAGVIRPLRGRCIS